eukprot:5246291-Alexandrium_andersonii.AAC.1
MWMRLRSRQAPPGQDALGQGLESAEAMTPFSGSSGHRAHRAKHGCSQRAPVETAASSKQRVI